MKRQSVHPKPLNGMEYMKFEGGFHRWIVYIEMLSFHVVILTYPSHDAWYMEEKEYSNMMDLSRRIVLRRLELDRYKLQFLVVKDIIV